MGTEATYNCGGDDVAYVTSQTLNCLPASHGRRISRIGRRICCSFASGNYSDPIGPEHERTIVEDMGTLFERGALREIE